MNNPYAPPQSPLLAGATPNAQLLEVARGQKEVIYAILLQLLGLVLYLVSSSSEQAAFLSWLALPLLIVALVLSLLGVFRMSVGFGMSTLARVLLLLGMFIGCINLLILLTLSHRANKALTDAGYKVGLLGAKL